MPRKPHPHKPFSVDFLGHFFQQRNPAFIVFDQVVIGREDGGDFLLNR